MGSSVSLMKEKEGPSNDLKSPQSRSNCTGDSTPDVTGPPPFGSFISKSAMTSTQNQMAYVLSNKEGKDAFEAFLSREFPTYFAEAEATIDSMECGGSMFQDVINEYERPEGMKHAKHIFGTEPKNILSDTSGSGGAGGAGGVGGASSAANRISVACAQQRAVTANMMALKSWPVFLQSDDYKKWNAENRKDSTTTATTDVDRSQGEEQHNDGLTFIERVDKEFEEIVSRQSWLVQLLESVETLPLCVSIATARKGQYGFPLVYVNSFFESTTGYPREEILGQNCKFLQTGKKVGQTAEATSIARLTTALAEGRQVKVAITNFRKDGTPFMNLLALRPIFDVDGEYAFVVGIQFDIGEDYGAPGRLKMVENVLNSLPDTIISGTPKVNFFK